MNARPDANPRIALPSVYTTGQYNREWIDKEAAYRRQLALARASREAAPARVTRARHATGILLIRAGVWLRAARFPPARRETSTPA